MKRNLTIAALACLALSACGKPARNVSFEREVVAGPQPAVVKADPDSSAAPDPDPGGTFAFAEDGGGKILAKILPPAEPARLPPDAKTGPKPRTGLAVLERPELPPKVLNPAIPGVSQAKRSPLRPHPPLESAPLADFRDDLIVPQRPELPRTELVRQLTRDVTEPALLPQLAKPLADRAVLDDPTAEFSGQRVVAHQPPMRETPTPFVRINLPEPFEHRAATKPLDSEPPVVSPVPAPPKMP
jgi:hypothetical protein